MAGSSGAPDTTPADPNRSIAISASLLTVFLVIIIVVAFASHRSSRLDPIREVVLNSLAILSPGRGLGPQAVAKIPTVIFHAPTRTDSSQVTSTSSPTKTEKKPGALSRFQPIAPLRYFRLAFGRPVDKKGGLERATSCSICTEDFFEGAELRLLPCGHVFHLACIDPWLQTRARTCPMCRGDMEALLGLERPPRVKILRTASHRH